jgi:hypothetical protein
MRLKCLKSGCNNTFTEGNHFIWKTTTDRQTKLSVCKECYDKRQKWLKERGLL